VKGQGLSERKCESRLFCAYLSEKRIDLHQTNLLIHSAHIAEHIYQRKHHIYGIV